MDEIREDHGHREFTINKINMTTSYSYGTIDIHIFYVFLLPFVDFTMKVPCGFGTNSLEDSQDFVQPLLFQLFAPTARLL